MSSPLLELVAKLCLYGYPGAPQTPDRQRLWVASMEADLRDVPPHELRAACEAYIGSTEGGDRYMPTPGRLRALTPTERRRNPRRALTDAEMEAECARLDAEELARFGPTPRQRLQHVLRLAR